MDRLAWRTAKAQLYLLEAAYIKDAVGRDRIRRNKDTLRELRCLQEILGDLHAGEFGRAPERRRKAAEAATNYWAALCKAVRTPEEHCEVPRSVKRFLLALPDAAGASGCLRALGGSEAATSTHAPSEAAMDLDSRSNATESHLSDISWIGEGFAPVALRPGGGQRLSRDQLDGLASELREQLEQEYTSLLSSIEEVQGLMEAEVIGLELLPPLEELEAFAVDAKAALQVLKAASKTVDSSSDAASRKLGSAKVGKLEGKAKEPCSPCGKAPKMLFEEALVEEPLLEDEPLRSATVLLPRAAQGDAPLEEVLLVQLGLDQEEVLQNAPPCSKLCDVVVGVLLPLPEPDERLADLAKPVPDAVDCDMAAPLCKASPASSSACTAQPVAATDSAQNNEMAVTVSYATEPNIVMVKEAVARPRWADLSDDDDEDAASLPSSLCRRIPSQLRPPVAAESTRNSMEAPRELSPRVRVTDSKAVDKATAECEKCMKLLGKDSFSRRAWREARGLGGAGAAGAADKGGAICRSCAE